MEFAFFRSSNSLLDFNMREIVILGRKDPEDITEQPYTTESLKYLKGGYKPLSQVVEILDVDFCNRNVSFSLIEICLVCS